MDRDEEAISGGILTMVDIAIMTVHQDQLQVVLIRRPKEPYRNTLSLPGGRILPDIDMDARDAALRVLKTKTGIDSPYLEQLETFTGKTRDPRCWSVSVAYYALVPHECIDRAFNADMKLVDVDRIPNLPFDHREIVDKAVARLRNKSQYSSLPCHLLGETFTLPQLQKVYEVVIGEPLNKVSFRRKIDEMDILAPVKGKKEEGVAHKPAQYFELRKPYRRQLRLLQRGL